MRLVLLALAAVFCLSIPATAGASFECSVNSGPFAACSDPFTITPLAVGTYTVQVRLAAPVGVTNFKAVPQAAGSCTNNCTIPATWNVPPGTDHLDSYRDGNLVSVLPGTQTSGTYGGSLACGTSHTMKLVAVDSSGARAPEAVLVASTADCQVIPPPPPPPPPGVTPCGGTPVNATPSTIAGIISSRNSVTINAAPGTYSSLSMHKTTKDSCVEIHCTASPKGASYPSWNSGGCLINGESTIESIHNLTIEGFVIRTTGAETYGFALYDESPDVNMHVRIANNVFADSTDHDISTKERVEYAEVVDNWFVNCRRHCWEIGQNGNIPSRPSTTGTALFSGNIVTSTINGLTQRYNLLLRVENNDFRSIGGNAVNTWPFWAIYLGETNMVPGTETPSAPKVPLRTIITGNKFSSGNSLRFTGRGVIDDTVLIKGNTGTPSCSRGTMDSQNSGTAAAHSNEETTAPPKLDPASDISC